MEVEDVNVTSSQVFETSFEGKLEGLEAIPYVANVLFDGRVTTLEVVRVLECPDEMTRNTKWLLQVTLVQMTN